MGSRLDRPREQPKKFGTRKQVKNTEEGKRWKARLAGPHAMQHQRFLKSASDQKKAQIMFYW